MIFLPKVKRSSTVDYKELLIAVRFFDRAPGIPPWVLSEILSWFSPKISSGITLVILSRIDQVFHQKFYQKFWDFFRNSIKNFSNNSIRDSFRNSSGDFCRNPIKDCSWNSARDFSKRSLKNAIRNSEINLSYNFSKDFYQGFCLQFLQWFRSEI